MERPQKERPATKERPTTKRRTARAVNHFLLRLLPPCLPSYRPPAAPFYGSLPFTLPTSLPYAFGSLPPAVPFCGSFILFRANAM